MRVGILIALTALSIASSASADPTNSVPFGPKHQSAMVDLSAVARTETSPLPAGSGGFVDPATKPGLVQVGDTRSHAQQGAGSAAREIALATPNAPVTDRPAAGRRIQERMDVRHALASLEPAFRACAGRGGSSPAMTLTLKLSVTPSGAVESADVTDAANARPELAACVAAVGAGAQFRAPGGVGASLVIPVSLPAQSAVPLPAPNRTTPST